MGQDPDPGCQGATFRMETRKKEVCVWLACSFPPSAFFFPLSGLCFVFITQGPWGCVKALWDTWLGLRVQMEQDAKAEGCGQVVSPRRLPGRRLAWKHLAGSAAAGWEGAEDRDSLPASAFMADPCLEGTLPNRWVHAGHLLPVVSWGWGGHWGTNCFGRSQRVPVVQSLSGDLLSTYCVPGSAGHKGCRSWTLCRG